MATAEDTHKVVSLRIDAHTLERIDYNAEQMALSRTQYLLSWLPETHDPTTGTRQNEQSSTGR